MKPRPLGLIFAALACVLAAEAGAGMYKWVDKDGHVIYGDRPPPGEAAHSEKINTSAVPLALQERLQQLDRSFSIKRISGNLDVAWVCLEFSAEERYEPAFVAAFNASNLGSIKQAAEVQYHTEYDNEGNPRSRSRKGDRCPEHRARGSDMRWGVYEIHFDPKTVNVYRGAAK